jgi:hypothetical protein
MVEFAYTATNPKTMVIKLPHTTLTFATMLRPIWLFNVAVVTKSLLGKVHLGYVFDALHWL